MGTRSANSACAVFMIMTGLFLMPDIARSRVSEFTYEEPRAGFGPSEGSSQKAANIYGDIVLGVPEKSRLKTNPIPASNGVIGLEVIVYGAQFGENSGSATENPPEQTVASWWSIILIAAGLIFYQLRRPVRPRIGSR